MPKRLLMLVIASACGSSSSHATDAGDVIDGVCGSANGVAVSAVPTTNLCSSGNPTDVQGTGPWVWLCLGGTGGQGASCGAPYAFPPGFANPECLPVGSGTFERHDLQAPSALPTNVSFVSDWMQNPIAGGFDGKQAMDDCRMKPDGFTTWHGKPAVRVEVDPGDDPLQTGSERAAVSTMQGTNSANFGAESGSNVTEYYATSYFFPTSWDGTFLSDDTGSWSFVSQFHYWGGLAAGKQSETGPQLYWFRDALSSNQVMFLDDGRITLGAWTDFVFRVDWSTLTFAIYRRDQGQTKFRLVVNASDPNMSGASYYEEGLDRGPHVNGRTDVLWIGPTSRGSTFAAVEQASFGTSDGL